MKEYESKIALDQDLIRTKPPINSFGLVEGLMKAVLREFEAMYMAQLDLMKLFYAMRSNDTQKFNEVKEEAQKGEPFGRHLENVWGYERRQANGETT